MDLHAPYLRKKRWSRFVQSSLLGHHADFIKHLATYAIELKQKRKPRADIESALRVLSHLRFGTVVSAAEVEAIVDYAFATEELPSLREFHCNPFTVVPDHLRLYHGNDRKKFIKLSEKKALFIEHAFKLYAKGDLPFPSSLFLDKLNPLIRTQSRSAECIRDWAFNTGQAADEIYGGRSRPGLIKVLRTSTSEFFLDLSWIPPEALFDKITI